MLDGPNGGIFAPWRLWEENELLPAFFTWFVGKCLADPFALFVSCVCRVLMAIKLRFDFMQTPFLNAHGVALQHLTVEPTRQHWLAPIVRAAASPTEGNYTTVAAMR